MDLRIARQSIWSKFNAEGKAYEDEDSIHSFRPLFLTFTVDDFHSCPLSHIKTLYRDVAASVPSL